QHEVDFKGWRLLKDTLDKGRTNALSGRLTVSDIEALLQVEAWVEKATDYVNTQNSRIDSLFAAAKSEGLQLTPNEFWVTENVPTPTLAAYLKRGISPDIWEKPGEKYELSVPPTLPEPASFTLQEILDQTVLPPFAGLTTRAVDLSGANTANIRST